MRHRYEATSEFKDQIGISVEGWRYEIRGVPVLIDSCFSEEEQEQICAYLESTLASMHPTLLPPIREILAPLSDRPAGASAATSDHRTGQICLWCNRSSMAPERLPQMELNLLEHEAAHLLFENGGAPDADEWLQAIDLDNPEGLEDQRLVVPRENLAGYDERTHVAEDWAWSVERLLLEDREGWNAFRRRYPNRAAIIDRVLREGS